MAKEPAEQTLTRKQCRNLQRGDFVLIRAYGHFGTRDAKWFQVYKAVDGEHFLYVDPHIEAIPSLVMDTTGTFSPINVQVCQRKDTIRLVEALPNWDCCDD